MRLVAIATNEIRVIVLLANVPETRYVKSVRTAAFEIHIWVVYKHAHMADHAMVHDVLAKRAAAVGKARRVCFACRV